MKTNQTMDQTMKDRT